jgi:hypothetical protein
MVVRWTPKFTVDAKLAGNVANLIFGRLALAFIILFAGLWWISDSGISLGAISRGYMLLFLGVVLLSVLYLIWLRLSRKLIWQIRDAVFYRCDLNNRTRGSKQAALFLRI